MKKMYTALNLRYCTKVADGFAGLLHDGTMAPNKQEYLSSKRKEASVNVLSSSRQEHTVKVWNINIK